MVVDIPTLPRLQIHYVGCTAPTPTKFVGVAIKLYYPELRLTPNALPNEIVAKPKFEENYNADGGFLLAKFGKIRSDGRSFYYSFPRILFLDKHGG